MVWGRKMDQVPDCGQKIHPCRKTELSRQITEWKKRRTTTGQSQFFLFALFLLCHFLQSKYLIYSIFCHEQGWMKICCLTLVRNSVRAKLEPKKRKKPGQDRRKNSGYDHKYPENHTWRIKQRKLKTDRNQTIHIYRIKGGLQAMEGEKKKEIQVRKRFHRTVLAMIWMNNKHMYRDNRWEVRKN